ncbi:polysaccharide biosynthesis C-terminal domain-containing protein [Daejeonella oryzae]|uniref:polysaccharide biosynthesis C-terminal domain-containing protein n=1 Tax=Daejeonella oryzae TaxID=1122943 RepID=UPI00040F5443|nr:NAD-dependent epimerase/dehydratase family protein [Daejeonella oryzae]
MVKIKVGITGQHGFVGAHLHNYLSLKEEIELIPFEKNYFDDSDKLQSFVQSCNAIVHLAAMNRHEDPQFIYDTNVGLVNKLIEACKAAEVQPHILFSSSTQEENDNLYGRSKRDGRLALESWSKENNSLVSGLVIPNVFGPFGKPFYNSVVATFCHQLTHGAQPQINVDSEVSLIYVNDLIEEIFSIIINPNKIEGRAEGALRYCIPAPYKKKVSHILQLLDSYKLDYLENGAFPDLTDPFKRDLFNTFRCYVPQEYYPHAFKLNIDNRGQFVEIARTNTPGQTSYSTTVPGITRGNHFHTRKAERFAVIKGKARIQLRKIDSDEVINYYLDGEKPSYVDMPVWFTHNITNIGEEELITLFWINEPFDQENPDTYFVNV